MLFVYRNSTKPWYNSVSKKACHPIKWEVQIRHVLYLSLILSAARAHAHIQITSTKIYSVCIALLKVHKIENFFDSDFGICIISLLVMSKY